MIRKWIALFLALALAAAMPLGALADVQHTLSVKPGDLLRAEEAIADLLEVIKLRLTLGEESGALGVLLNDDELLTLGLGADADGMYAASNLFGTDVLFVGWDDAAAAIGEMLVVSMADSGIDAEVLLQLQNEITEAQKQIAEAANAVNAETVGTLPASMQENMEIIGQMFPNDPEMAACVTNVYENMVIESGDFTSEARDAADQKYRLTMDEKDLLVFCETAYVKNAVAEAVKMERPGASETEIEKAAEEALLEVKKLYEESAFELIMEMYTQDAGQTLVGMDMIMNMELAETEEQKTHVQMAAVYHRLTDADGVAYRAEGALAVDSNVAEMAFELYCGNDGVDTGMIGMLADGEEVVVTYKTQKPAEDTCVRSADLYLRSGASAIVTPAASDRPVLGVELVTEPAPAEVLAALENAEPDDGIKVLQLSETQKQELVNRITLNATQVFYNALGQLPTSTLGFAMQMLMTE